MTAPDPTPIPYQIRQIDDPPALLGAWLRGFRYVEHGPDYVRDIQQRWSSLTTPHFYILDLSELEVVTFEGIISSTRGGVGGPAASLRHPMNRGTVFVSRAEVIRSSARSISQDALFRTHIVVVETVEAALEYCRHQLGEPRGPSEPGSSRVA